MLAFGDHGLVFFLSGAVIGAMVGGPIGVVALLVSWCLRRAPEEE